MRRSNQEFKAEIALRAKAYRAEQKQKCLKLVSAAASVMMCLIIVLAFVSSPLGRTDKPEGWPENLSQEANDEHADLTENNEEHQDGLEGELPENLPDGTNASPENATLTEIEDGQQDGERTIVSLQIIVFWSEGDEEVVYESVGVDYPGSRAVECLVDYLEELWETEASDHVHTESPERTTEHDSVESAVNGYQIRIRYSDEEDHIYTLRRGEKFRLLNGETMILDELCWKMFLELLQKVTLN